MGHVETWRNYELISTIDNVPRDDQLRAIGDAIDALPHRPSMTTGASVDEVADLAPGLAEIKHLTGAARKLNDWEKGLILIAWVPDPGE